MFGYDGLAVAMALTAVLFSVSFLVVFAYCHKRNKRYTGEWMGFLCYFSAVCLYGYVLFFISVATFCFVCVCGERGCLVEVGLLVVCNFFLFILIIFSSLPLVITLVSSLVVSVIMNASFSCLLLSPPHEFYVVVFLLIYLCFFYALALLFLLSTALQFVHVYVSSRVELHLEDVQMKHFYVLFSAFFLFLDMA